MQAILSDDRIAYNQFAVTMFENMDKDNEFLRKIMFSDEVTFHVSGKVNKQNICIGEQNTLMLEWSTLQYNRPKYRVL
jgi:hypothetical protein